MMVKDGIDPTSVRRRLADAVRDPRDDGATCTRRCCP